MKQYLFVFCVLFLSSACGCKSKNSSAEIDGPAADSGVINRGIVAERFVNLYDTTEVLQAETYVSLQINSMGGFIFNAILEEDDIRYKYTTRDTCIWKDPCIEFFFDPGADGLDYYEMQFNAKSQVWDLKLRTSKGPINAPENMIEWDIGDNWGIYKLSGTVNDSSDKDQSWSIVGSIPWDKIAEGKPKKGDKWAYNFMRVDYDKNNNPSYWVAKSTGKENIHHPETWPVFTF